MKTFKLISNKLTPPIVYPRNAYEVEFTFMHGDADAYTKESLTFPDDTAPYAWGLGPDFECDFEGLTIDNVLNFWDQYKKLTRYNVPKDVFKQLYGFSQDVLDAIQDFIPGDCTTDHQWPAKITNFKVFRWDSFGDKYNVEVVED